MSLFPADCIGSTCPTDTTDTAPASCQTRDQRAFNITSRNVNGDTPLHFAAASGAAAAVALLLRYGGDQAAAAQNLSGLQPLHVAAAAGCRACTQVLLKWFKSHSVEVGRMSGSDPASLEKVKASRTAALIDDVDTQGNTPLHYAARSGGSTQINFLAISQHNVFCMDYYGKSVEVCGSLRMPTLDYCR
jgi:ankyrin repeat protein